MNPMEEIIRSAESAQLRALPAQTACQGVAGAFSHKACLEVFEQPDIQFYPSFEEVFAAVSSGQRRYGVIPIENTLAGSVTDNYDLMLQYGLYIVGSVKVKIEHALLALPNASLEELRQVYSHEQALHQCSDFLKAHPQLTARPYSNTAASAKLVAEQKDPSLAAIGSVQCARMYGLQLLMPAIQNRSDNFTRFVILAKQPLHHPDCQRISLIVRVQHRAGALYNALSRFAVRGINLLKLESRPIPDSPFEFLFYWDFDGNLDDERVVQALHQLREDTQYIQILGNYPEAPFSSPSL